MARVARDAQFELLEDPFRKQIEQLSEFYGWLGYHTHDSRRSAPGYPDSTFVRGPELLFVEFKTDKGRVKPDQKVWLEALDVVARRVAALVAGSLATVDTAVAFEVHVWRPRDFEEIHARLARGRYRQEPVS